MIYFKIFIFNSSLLNSRSELHFFHEKKLAKFEQQSVSLRRSVYYEMCIKMHENEFE